jgi:predicted flap endonuclease-1-like 5' DNA nuclease/chromosome segregation ATPase
MPINREREFVEDHLSEESRVRRAPLDNDDAHELADHEFTLVTDDAVDESRGWPYDEHTAPWSTLPPLPAWATKARALLEPPTLPRPLNDETPTLVEEGDHVSASGMRALRAEITSLLREAHARNEHIEQLERALAKAVQARAEAELGGNQTAALQGRVQGQAQRMLELEEELRALKSEREAGVGELEASRALKGEHEAKLRELNAAREAQLRELSAAHEAQLRELSAAHEAQLREHEAKLRELNAAHEAQVREQRVHYDARVSELEHEVRALKAVQEVRTAAIEELRELKAEQESQVAELENELREVKKAHKARVAKHEAELRELKDEQHASAVALAELRALKVEHEQRAEQLATELQQLRAAEEQRTAEVERERREYHAAQGVRAAELEELSELREVQEEQAAELATLSELNTALEQQVGELEAELQASKAAHETQASELAQLRELKAAYDAHAPELERLRELKATYADEAAELDRLRAHHADAEQTTDLEHLREHKAYDAPAAELERLRELKAAYAAQTAELEQLRELKAAHAAQSTELEQLRELKAAHAAQSTELERLRELAASRDDQTASFEQLRELAAIRDAQAAELQQLRERVAAHEQHLVTGVASDSETDIEKTVEWITNAAPSVEVTIEVDANDDDDPVAPRAAAPSLDADDDEQLAAAAAPHDAERLAQIDRATTLHVVETSSDFDTVAPANDFAAGSGSADSARGDFPRADAGEFAAASLPNPETTLEIDPDHDLFDLEADLPPLAIPAPAAGSGKRKVKRRAATARDDFQQIQGIGKRLEQRLHAKGIRTYAQLAVLRAADLPRLAKQIGVTPERIAREAWIGQAKRLKKSAPKRRRAAPASRKQKHAGA